MVCNISADSLKRTFRFRILFALTCWMYSLLGIINSGNKQITVLHSNITDDK